MEEPDDIIPEAKPPEMTLKDFIQSRAEAVVEAEMRKFARSHFEHVVLPMLLKEVRRDIHTKLVSSRGGWNFEVYYGSKDDT